MKKAIRVLSLLLSICLLLSALSIVTFAEKGTTNLSVALDKENYHPGDTVTVTVSVASAKLSSFTGFVVYDADMIDFLDSTAGSLTTSDGPVRLTVEESTEYTGVVGFYLASGDEVEYTGGSIVMRFRAKKAGTIAIVAFEDSDGTDGYIWSKHIQDFEDITEDDLQWVAYNGAIVTQSYKDVTDPSAWYYNAIQYVSFNGIFSGYTSGPKAGNFGVSDPIQRQDFLVALARYHSVDAASYTGNGGFKDVDAGAYYAFAVVWGAQTNVTSGYTSGPNAGKFGVGDYITREQLVTFMYRYAKLIKADTDVTTDASYWSARYPDWNKVSDFSKEAIIWALEKGVISGKTVNGVVCISPQGNAQRCEVAQIFYNIYNNGVFDVAPTSTTFTTTAILM